MCLCRGKKYLYSRDQWSRGCSFPESPTNQVQRLRIETNVQSVTTFRELLLFSSFPPEHNLLETLPEQKLRGRTNKASIRAGFTAAELMSHWHKESTWDRCGCWPGTWYAHPAQFLLNGNNGRPKPWQRGRIWTHNLSSGKNTVHVYKTKAKGKA